MSRTWETVSINNDVCTKLWLYLIKRKKPHLIFENRYGPYLFKVKFPSPKDALGQVWWSWRRRLLTFLNVLFPAISSISVLGKGLGSSFEQTWIPFTQGCFEPICLKLVYWCWRRWWKYEKLQTNGQTDGRTVDNGRSEKVNWVFS